MKRNISLTKSGMPAMWESGGAMTNSANCVIIGDRNAQRKKPVFIRTGGHLSNDNHALFILNKDDTVVVGTRSRSDYTYVILKYVGYEKVGQGVIGEFVVVNHFSDGVWDNELDPKYTDILESARVKMNNYHCRDTVYALGLNVVADTLRDIRNGKIFKLNKSLSTTPEIIDEYFKCNKGKEREVLEQFDFSDFGIGNIGRMVRYVPWQYIRAKVNPDTVHLYEMHRNTNYLYHFIIAPNTFDDDYIDEMGYQGVSFEIAETRDFNDLPENKKINFYLGRIVVYVNFVHVPEDNMHSYALSDALYFIMDYGNGRRLCLYEHLSHITRRPPTIHGVGDRADEGYSKPNPYSASCLIRKDE